MILVPFHHLHLHALFFGEFLFLVIVDSIADMLICVSSNSVLGRGSTWDWEILFCDIKVGWECMWCSYNGYKLRRRASPVRVSCVNDTLYGNYEYSFPHRITATSMS
jgi:hypothetical protein